MAESWKLSYVVPIFKNGNKQDVKNYRTVSVLSPLAKIFDSLLAKKLVVKLGSKITGKQHGFTPGLSTQSNLALFNNELFSAAEQTIQTDVIFIDFEKAFDSVDQGLLVKTLFDYGLRGNLLKLIGCYLFKR